ncbi:MAG: 50S ribosomal protein L13 [Oscillospiraceae bacterium]|nr:50S ribosomal protein L13 [Oscillospiraceae bacterium]
MSTYMPKAGDITRKWYLLDAQGKSLGRVAAQAAHILRGKHKPTYAPHADCGDHVIVINCSKAVLTGKKLEQKTYKWHTGWISGLKEIKYSDMMKKEPERAMMIAVNGMLPNTTLGRKALTRLRVYPGAEHKQQAQMPVNYEVKG